MPSVSTPIYNTEGKKIGTAALPPEIFDVKINADLIYQVVVAQMANKRQVLAHAKDKSEVRGGGRKPWRQKGTGRARHGSIRSPIWRGGGATFGPTKKRIFKKKINKKMKRKALFMVLTSKVKDSELILLDKLEIKEPKTKIMAKTLESIFKKQETPAVAGQSRNKKQTKSVLVVIPEKDENIVKASRNISFAKILRADSLNILDLLSFKYLLMPKKAIKIIQETYVQKA